jgi:thioesterase domain-containing protein
VKARFRRHRTGAPQQRARPSRHELQELRLQYFQAALLEYEPGTFDGRVLLFTSLHADRSHHFEIEPDLGWAKVVRGELSVQSFPGDHLAILIEPNASVVAKHIAAAAAESLRRLPSRGAGSR